jgi:hypothetical protein
MAGFDQTGVTVGCAVTAQGTPDMTVAVASGTITVQAVTATVTSGNVTIGAAGVSPRFDLVVAGSTGTKSVTAGTAAANPVFPTIPASSVVLAAVYVPVGATAITSGHIVDKRVLVRPSGAVGRRFTTVTATGTTTLADDTADEIVNVTTSTGAVTIVLPTAVSKQNKLVTVKNATGTQTVTVDPFAAETIDGQTTFSLINDESLSFYSDNTNWQVT